MHVWKGIQSEKQQRESRSDGLRRKGKWRDEADRKRRKEEEKDRQRKREKEGKSEPVSPDRGSTLYFRLPHNWNSIYWDLCVPLSLSLSVASPLFIHCNISHVEYTVRVKYSWGCRRGSCKFLYFFVRNAWIALLMPGKELTMSNLPWGGRARRLEPRPTCSLSNHKTWYVFSFMCFAHLIIHL